MKKRLFIFVIILVTMFPVVALAADNNLEILSTEIINKSDGVIINNTPSFSGLNLNLNAKFSNLGDYAEYKIIVRNNSNKELNFTDSFVDEDNNLLDYVVEFENDSKIIPAKKTREVYVKVTYQNQTPKELFRSSQYNIASTLNLGIGKTIISIPNTLRNIGIFRLIIICCFIGYAIRILFFKNNSKKYNTNIVLLIFAFALIPLNTTAAEEYSLVVSSNILVENVKPNLCSYDGQLTQGSIYRLDDNPQYEYRYKQEFNGTEWINIDIDGWGVSLIDRTSTNEVNEKLCSTINDKSIVSMSNMFKDSKATKIDLSSFVTNNVVNMSDMFNGADTIEELDLSTFNTENVTSMSNMFKNCTGLSSLFLRHFVTSNVRNIDNIFSGDSNLVSINMDKWELTNITNQSNVLTGATGLKTISAKEWTIPSVFSDIFISKWNCGSSPIETIDVSNWDFENVSNISGLFSNINTLKIINGLDTWDISSVSNLNKLFYGCSKLTELDLSNFDLSNVSNYTDMISGLSALDDLITPKEYGTTILPISRYLFDDNFDMYKQLNTSSPKSEHLYTITVLNEGWYARRSMGWISSGKDYDNIKYNNIQAIKREKDKSKVPSSYDTTTMSAWYSRKPVTIWYSNRTIYYYCDDEKIYMNPNSDSAFSYMEELRTFDISSIYSDAVTSMSATFLSLRKLESLDVSHFNTSKVTNMYSAFENLESILELDLSSFDTSKVTDMGYIFANNYKMRRVDVSSFDTSNVTTMGGMFYCNSGLLSLDLSNFNTSKVTNMSYMFSYAADLREINLSSFDTSNVTNFSAMFSECHMLRELDLSNFDFSKATVQQYYSPTIFNENYGLISLKTPINRTVEMSLKRSLYDSEGNEYTTMPVGDESLVLTAKKEANFNTGSNFNSNIKSLSGSAYAIKKIVRAESLPDYPIHPKYYSDYNIVSLTDSQYPIYAWFDSTDGTIYYYCELDKIYMNKNAYEMFSYIDNAVSIDLTGIDTSKTTNMDYLFKNDKALKELDLSNFDTSHVTTFYGAFKYLTAMTRLDLSSFDTSSATYMAEMLGGCSSLQYLDISNFVVDNVYSFDRFLTDTYYIKELKAPKSYGNKTISLPNSMYPEGASEPISVLSSNLPPSTVLKRNPW